MNGLFMPILVLTFASDFSGIGYYTLAGKRGWPVGTFWNSGLCNTLCFVAMALPVLEAWLGYGVWIALTVVILGSLSSFTLTAALKGKVQFLNLLGITAGTTVSLLGERLWK